MVRPKIVLEPGHLKRMITFAAIGVANTSLYFLLANALVYLGRLEQDVASYLAYVTLLPVSFFGHRKVTFGSKGRAVGEWTRFCLMQAVCIFIIAGVNFWFAGLSRAHSWVAFAIISVLIPSTSFVAMQMWVFAKRHQR